MNNFAIRNDVRSINNNEAFNRLENTLNSFAEGREAELTARDNQFDKLLDWARKVSKKTGIPLEDL